ncbi:hypothetical protein [uncultured Sphingomonas sp.]|uniref:hypothetical protein n=1 Tax=uncultured Sphingomonas sp. TaxID=158754 RepID=UPI0025CC7CAC|nr:hypothetical protein [uncultured Sphingomonas sp.]
MASKVATSRLAPIRRGGALRDLKHSPVASFLDGEVLELHKGSDGDLPPARQQAVLAAYLLQELPDYRAALQRWFGAVRVGGTLVVVVPHAFLYDRQLELPSPREPLSRRLYTPASLMAEVEEALAPNSYRVRYLGDWDVGYDYAAGPGREPRGHSDVLLVLERLPSIALSLDVPHAGIIAPEPDYAFEPVRTRIEVAQTFALRRILILKLDHMGDFILAIGALERLRATFPQAELTLVVGSWNVQIARELGLADTVIAFDAFPRNSSEEEVDVAGKAALFQALIQEDYDLAIDLRVDVDTRFLLRHVRAPLRAGIGTAAQFPFLDIFLPLDFNRNRPETAREYHFDHHLFISQGPVERREHRLIHRADTVERFCAILWGPYERLRPGNYLFEPRIEWGDAGAGMLMLDIGLDTRRVAYRLAPPFDAPIRIPFTVERADTEFEFRIFVVEDFPSVDFSFYGGRLIRQGAGSTLHQSEYGALLVELVAIRLARTGVLTDVDVTGPGNGETGDGATGDGQAGAA